MGTAVNIAIIGCGLIGFKRAKNLGAHNLVFAVDTEIDRAKKLVAQNGGTATTNWRSVISNSSVDAVIVATTPDVMPEIARAAMLAGKHVLVDKPAGRSSKDLQPALQAARSTGLVARIGFNHRYHPAMQKAHELFRKGELGELMYIRGRYGHGGRIGYENEWRAQPEVSGGGELIDQGSHLIDLSRWFLGDFETVSGHAGTFFWNMPVDDNAFMLLRTRNQKVAMLHASWTEWKNLFCFEIFGKDAKLQIDGLGGSYGVETLTYYKMKPEMGPPDVQKWEYRGEDQSWKIEFEEFVSDIRSGRAGGPTLEDADAVLKIAEQIYAQSKKPVGAV